MSDRSLTQRGVGDLEQRESPPNNPPITDCFLDPPSLLPLPAAEAVKRTRVFSSSVFNPHYSLTPLRCLAPYGFTRRRDRSLTEKLRILV